VLLGTHHDDARRQVVPAEREPCRYALCWSPDEQTFAAQNLSHDAAYTMTQLLNWLVTNIAGVAYPETGGPVERNEYIPPLRRRSPTRQRPSAGRGDHPPLRTRRDRHE
jgi:hypothetical protein